MATTFLKVVSAFDSTLLLPAIQVVVASAQNTLSATNVAAGLLKSAQVLMPLNYYLAVSNIVLTLLSRKH